MLTTTVENFPGFPEGVQGPEFVRKLTAQAEKFGARIEMGIVTSYKKKGDTITLIIDEKKKIEGGKKFIEGKVYRNAYVR